MDTLLPQDSRTRRHMVNALSTSCVSISYIIKNYLEIEDSYLQQEVEICIKKDEHYGPVIENIKKDIN